MAISVPTGRPRHGFVIRDAHQNNGFFVPQEAYYVHSGTIADIPSETTGSQTLHFDAYGVKLKRFEIFHSGTGATFDVSLETVRSGSAYDPRNIVVDYQVINGSANFSSGIDRVEDLVAITDLSGNLYLNVIPKGSGLNTFKYLAFFEATYIYVER